MGNPTPYEPEYSFTGYQAINPTRPLPAPELDNELANISEATDSARLAIMDVRRSDGALQNSIVTPDSFDASARAMVAAGGNPRGAWAAATTYAISDLVTFNGTTYIAVTAHTSSSSFTDDYAAGDWMTFAISGDITGVPYFEFFDGSGVSQTLTLADNFGTNPLSVEVYIKEDGVGFERKDPGTYTLDGTDLTGTFPAGARTVLVFGPSSSITAAISGVNDALIAVQAAQEAAESAQDFSEAAKVAAQAARDIAIAESSAAEVSADAAAASALAAAASVGSVKVTASDTTPGVLNSKVNVTAPLAKATGTPGGNETLDLTLSIASQAQAEAGVATNVAMTPQRTAQAIAALVVQPTAASQTEQEAASSTTKFVSPGRQQSHPSAAKAWVDFTPAGGGVTVNASYNITGVTRSNTGDYQITFDVDFSSANYAVAASVEATGGLTNIRHFVKVSRAAGTCSMLIADGTGTGADNGRIGAVFYGDQ